MSGHPVTPDEVFDLFSLEDTGHPAYPVLHPGRFIRSDLLVIKEEDIGLEERKHRFSGNTYTPAEGSLFKGEMLFSFDGKGVGEVHLRGHQPHAVSGKIEIIIPETEKIEGKIEEPIPGGRWRRDQKGFPLQPLFAPPPGSSAVFTCPEEIVFKPGKGMITIAACERFYAYFQLSPSRF